MYMVVLHGSRDKETENATWRVGGDEVRSVGETEVANEFLEYS